MNNKEFISTLAADTGYTQADTQKMVNTVIEAMKKAFEDGDSVQITNFGSFEVKKRLERIVVNPATDSGCWYRQNSYSASSLPPQSKKL